MTTAISIPSLGSLSELDAASHRLIAGMEEIRDALIAWGTLALADYLVRHPCIGSLSFEWLSSTRELGVVPRPRLPERMAPKDNPGQGKPINGRELFLYGRPEWRDAAWDAGTQRSIQEAFDEAEAWEADTRLSFISVAAGEQVVAFEAGSDFEGAILNALGRHDLRSRIEAGRLASCSLPGEAVSAAPRI